MKAYIMTTAAVFGVITLAHILRIILESRHLATNPIFFLLTVASASLCIWALSLLRKGTRP